MQIHPHHVIFDEVIYDRDSLVAWYLEHQHLRVDFGHFQNRLWQQSRGGARSDRLSNRPFRPGQFDTIDTWTTMGRHIRSFSAIDQAVSRFCLDPDIRDHQVDVLIYRPGWQFHPHTDHAQQCGIMWPILPLTGAAPIDFYQMPPGASWQPARDYSGLIDHDRDLIYSYHYSDQHPSMFRGTTIHGVRNGRQERVFLRMKITQSSFDDIVTRAQQGLLIRPEPL